MALGLLAENYSLNLCQFEFKLAADAKNNRRELMNRCAMALELASERKEKVITSDLVQNMDMAL